MMKRLRLHIDHDAVTVALVGNGRVIWRETATLDRDDGQSRDIGCAATAMRTLLDRAPILRRPWLYTDVVIGSPWSRIKLVRGMPPVRRRQELVAMLRLNVTRFVASPHAVIITGADIVSQDECNVGVIDAAAVTTITREVTSRHLRMGWIAPAASMVSDEHAAIVDKGMHDAILTAEPAPQLMLRRPDNPAAAMPDISRRHVGIAAAAFVICVSGYVAVQLINERRMLARSRSAVGRLAITSDSGVREQAELGQISRGLATAAAFSRSRVSTALLLGAITAALPNEAAITTLRMDTASVDIVTLSPRIAAVVDAMANVPQVTSPTIIGPVSREMVGTIDLERATIRMRVIPSYGLGKAPFTPGHTVDR